jgi:IclR family acetate operon transcriptional repressor
LGVKRSQSGTRILAVLEEVARRHPIGVSELARGIGEDKSAVQRALATLGDEGWIRPTLGKPVRWEPTARLSVLARLAGGQDLAQRFRPALQLLRDETGETVLLALLDGDRFVITDSFEGRHFLRTAPPLGLIVSAANSATARAVLPFMSAERQAAFLGGPPDAAQAEDFRLTRARGYSVTIDEIVEGATTLASALFEGDEPVGAVLLSAPSDRLGAADHATFGERVAATARRFSPEPAL